MKCDRYVIREKKKKNFQIQISTDLLIIENNNNKSDRIVRDLYDKFFLKNCL